MSLHRLLPLLAVLALLMGTAATPVPTGHLTAASVEATGPSTTTADLAGLFIRGAPAPTFSLDADHLTIENHHANATLMVQGPLGGRYNVAGDPDLLHDDPGLLTGHALRPTNILWVLPLEGHTAPTLTASAADCTTLDAPEKNAATTRAQVNGLEPEWTVDTSPESGAAVWRTCTDATATVTGDFLFVLWERDAILTTPDGATKTLRTGHQDAHPGTPIDGTFGTADELFITVRGGSLTLPLAPGAHELYLRTPHTEADSWRFRDASGTLPGVGAVEGTVKVAGSLAATITGAGAGAPLGADVAGQPKHVEVNGAPVAVTAPAAGTSRISVSPWVAVGAVVGVLLAVLAWSRRVRREGGADSTDAGSDPGEVQARSAVVRLDPQAEARVLTAVRASPGLTVRELLSEVGVSKERAYRALDALLGAGALVQEVDGARRHLFVPEPGLERVWLAVARLRDAKYRTLWSWLHGHPGAAWRDVLTAATAWGWGESTAKDRLRGLMEAGLAVREGPPRRGTISALPMPFP